MMKWIRRGALILVCGLIVGLFAYSIAHNSKMENSVWDKGTTIGDPETAVVHYVQYTDLACPYCDVFTRLAIENEEEFNRFIEENHILYEIRMNEMIYNNTGSTLSRNSNIASYCALNEDKFVEYYHAAVMKLYEDYHSKGIGDTKTSPMIPQLPIDYWLEIGHELGLGETFDNCVKNEETLDKVLANTTRATQSANGLPYFQFGKFATAGFDPSWDYSYVEYYLESGLPKE